MLELVQKSREQIVSRLGCGSMVGNLGLDILANWNKQIGESVGRKFVDGYINDIST